jgi:2-phosphosulfolactate phosphatase
VSRGIDVALTPEELSRVCLSGVTAVMIDALRASTTIVTALANGAQMVAPVATPEEAAARARNWPGALLGGEREGAPPPGFECGNSPAEYTPDRVAGRRLIFTTTNGTRALLALAGAHQVAVAAFVNAAAVVRWLAPAPGGALFVCAGESGRFCLEDATCAGLLVERLHAAWPGAALSDAARAAALLYGRYRRDLGAMLAEATWARLLTAQGRGEDLPLCVALDIFDVVPVAEDGQLVRRVTPAGPAAAAAHGPREAPGP